jgi:hypothetical protein
MFFRDGFGDLRVFARSLRWCPAAYPSIPVRATLTIMQPIGGTSPVAFSTGCLMKTRVAPPDVPGRLEGPHR